jgi:glycosyltransferase involved in cell wall biosynthesis
MGARVNSSFEHTSRLQVLICTHRRPLLLVRLLDSLERSAVAGSMQVQILIINNDSGRLEIESSQFRCLGIRIIDEPKLGLAHARNRAIAESCAPYLIFLDDDQIVGNDFFSELQSIMDSPAAECAAIRLPVVYSDTPSITRSSIHPILKLMSALRQEFGSGGLLLTRSWLDRLGDGPIFDPRLNHIGAEDTDLFLQATALKLSILTANAPVITEYSEASRRKALSIWRSSERKGYADLIVDLKHDLGSRWFWNNFLKTMVVILPSGMWCFISIIFGRSQFQNALQLMARQIGKLKALFGFNLKYYPAESRRPIRIIATQDLRLGGAEKVILDLANPSSGSQFESQVFLYHSTSQSPLDHQASQLGIHALRHRKTLRIDPGIILKMNTIAGWLDAKTYHSHDMGSLIYGAALKLIRPRMKFFHSVHTLHTVRHHRRYRLLSKLILNKLYTNIIAVGPSVSHELNQRFGLIPNKIVVIPNGIDTSRFTDRGPKPFGLNLNKHPIKLAAVSRISDEKRLDWLLRAISLAHKQGIALELHHFGTGEAEPWARLKSTAHSFGIADRIHWHGFVDDVGKALSSMDAFVSASSEECHPVSVIEAICSDLPVFISRIAPHQTFAQIDGVHLFDSPTELANLIGQYFSENHKQGGKLHDRDLQRFDNRLMHVRYDSLFLGSQLMQTH